MKITKWLVRYIILNSIQNPLEKCWYQNCSFIIASQSLSLGWLLFLLPTRSFRGRVLDSVRRFLRDYRRHLDLRDRSILRRHQGHDRRHAGALLENVLEIRCSGFYNGESNRWATRAYSELWVSKQRSLTLSSMCIILQKNGICTLHCAAFKSSRARHCFATENFDSTRLFPYCNWLYKSFYSFVIKRSNVLSYTIRWK